MPSKAFAFRRFRRGHSAYRLSAGSASPSVRTTGHTVPTSRFRFFSGGGKRIQLCPIYFRPHLVAPQRVMKRLHTGLACDRQAPVQTVVFLMPIALCRSLPVPMISAGIFQSYCAGCRMTHLPPEWLYSLNRSRLAPPFPAGSVLSPPSRVGRACASRNAPSFTGS